MAAPQATPDAGASVERLDELQALVLQTVRSLAQERGGERALRAVAPTASLERDIGLDSLDRVELLLRLETALGRELDDRFLAMDTAAEIARALLESPGSITVRTRERAAPLPPAAEIAVSAATIQEALWRRAAQEPDRTHVHLRGDNGLHEDVTYGMLWERATAVAGGLHERGIRKGETVALMLPTGLDFLGCFQGILLAGAVPVPLYPPLRLDRLEEYLLRQRGILDNSRAHLLIAIEQAEPVARVLRQAVPTLSDVTTAASIARHGAPVTEATGSASDPALIQYTSGSTGSPKGVLLSHANLLANIRAIAAGVDLKPTDVGASWLPLYHDMGLIGTWLFALVHGIPLALQSPVAFLTRPERWLWTIHQRRATLSAAPNFAYELCARRIPDAALEGLDLSSWRCALNGSEPVSPDTLDRFARRFAPYGFRREAFMPVYGLAECSVALCFPPLGRGPRVDRVIRESFEQDGHARSADSNDATALHFVSVGAPLPEHEVRLVNEAREEVPERTVGRLLFRGPSSMAGYFGNPEATQDVRRPDGWLDSGDLAYRAAGELYIVGRVKDLIIKSGRNIIPQDIEEIVSSVEGIRKGNVVAFGIADEELGTEQLIVVAETRVTDGEAKRALEAALISRVAEGIGHPPDRVVLAPPGSIPKTSSGKLRRGATRDLYRAGRLGERPRVPLRQRVGLLAGEARLALTAALASVMYALYVGYLALALLVLCAVLWPLVAIAPRRRAVFVLQRFGARLALWLMGVHVTVEGLEHLREQDRVIMASNHTSYADIAALVARLPLDFVFVAKREVLTWPVVGTFVRKARHPTVDRWDPQQSVADARAITESIRRGASVLFFPEGTFRAATGLRPFRSGVFQAAAETGKPVIPVAIRGARHVLRDDELRPHRGTIHVWIGPAIEPSGTSWLEVVALRNRVADAIAAHCGEPRLDLVASGPEPEER